MKSTNLIPCATLLASLALTLPSDAQRGGGGARSGFGGVRSSPGRVSSPVRVSAPARPSSFQPSSSSRGSSTSYRPSPVSISPSRPATTPSRPVYVPPVSSTSSRTPQARSSAGPAATSLGVPSSSGSATTGNNKEWGPNRVMDSSALRDSASVPGAAGLRGNEPQEERRVRFPASYTSAVYARREAEDNRLRQLAGDGLAANRPTDATLSAPADLRRSAPAFTQASLQRVFSRNHLPAVETARDAYGRGPVERLAAPDATLERIASGRSASEAGSNGLVSTAVPDGTRAEGLVRVPSPAPGAVHSWRAFEGPDDPILNVTPPGCTWAWGVTWSFSSCWSYCSPAYPWSWCYTWPWWYCTWWSQPVVPVYLPGYGYGYGAGYGPVYGSAVYESAVYDSGGAVAMEVGEAAVVGEGVAENAFDAEADAAARLAAAERYLTLGDRAFREERYQDAVQFYSKAVDLVPEEGVLHMNLADALFATGDYHWAAAQIRRALDLDPNLVDDELDKHEFYLDPSEFDRQLVTLELYIRDHPTDSDSRLVLALNYLYGSRAADALDLFEDDYSYALRSDPAAVLIKAAAGR